MSINLLRQTINFALSSISTLCPICAALLLMGSCSITGIHPPPPSAGTPVELKVGDVVETSSGNVMNMDELVSILSKVSVVYVGETHTSTEDHKIQLEILQKLSQTGRCVELAMEMFPVSAQPILNSYIDGKISEEEFLKETSWDKVWGFPYSLYRDLVNWQKARHMPVLGLNAPNDIVREIAHNGLASLTAEERSQVALAFHLDDPANRERMIKEYTSHEKGGIKDFKSFLEAQAAWEETMAQTLSQRLQRTGAKCIIVATIGKGHISGRLGVPYLTRLRTPHEYVTVAPVPIDYLSSVIDPNIAEFVVIVDKSESFHHRPILGITIKPAASGGGVEILEVFPKSPAAEAHLYKGDVIVSVNGAPVTSVDQLRRAISENGTNFKILVERGRKKIKIDLNINLP